MSEHLHLSVEHVALSGTAILLFFWLMYLGMQWLAGHAPGMLANVFAAVGTFYSGPGHHA